MVNTLLTKKVEAIVFDAPILLFYAANEGKSKVEVVGSIFREENYGTVLPKESPARKKSTVPYSVCQKMLIIKLFMIGCLRRKNLKNSRFEIQNSKLGNR